MDATNAALADGCIACRGLNAATSRGETLCHGSKRPWQRAAGIEEAPMWIAHAIVMLVVVCLGLSTVSYPPPSERR